MVAMNTWPTDANNGSVANEARWRSMARMFARTGVLPNGGVDELTPSLNYPALTIKPGACWVDGHYCELTSEQVLTATANGTAVVRFHPADNTAELLWRDGVSVFDPTEVVDTTGLTLPWQNGAGPWEMPIARTVNQALTDMRTFTGYAAETPFSLAPQGMNAGQNASATSAPWKFMVQSSGQVVLDAFMTVQGTTSGGNLVSCSVSGGSPTLAVPSEMSMSDIPWRTLTVPVKAVWDYVAMGTVLSITFTMTVGAGTMSFTTLRIMGTLRTIPRIRSWGTM